MNKKGLLNIIFCVGISLAIFSGCGGDKNNSSSQSMNGMSGMFAAGAIPVKVDTVKIESISEYILTNTTIEAQREVDIIARVPGIVENFSFEEGATVRKGNVIAKLDDRELKLNVDQAKAKLDNTKSLFDRSKDMFNKNIVSKEIFDDAQFQYETAKSQYDNAVLQLEYASIRAPLNGIITKRSLEIGDFISNNQVVYTMADYDVLWAKIYVPEKEIGKIKPGQKAKIEVEAFPEKSFDAKVKMINPVIDPTSGTVKVTVEILRGKTGILPGMFASVYILTQTHDKAKVIPKKSLILESETDRIFVFENGEALLRDVKVGFIDGNRIEILNGINDGDVVITVGQEGLRDGASVRIIGASQPENMTANQQQGRPFEANAQFASQKKAGSSSGESVDPDRLKRMEERMLQNPEIKKQFEKRAKEDPDFKNNPKKKASFFQEMFQKMSR